MAITAPNVPRKHKLSVTDYYRLAAAGSLHEDDRVELIDGEIMDMPPIGSLHASRVVYLTQAFQEAVREKALVSVQNPLRLGTYSEPQPDLMLLQPRADYYASAHPGAEDVLLVVEVADASLDFDRDTKLPLYARHGIPEVWLVDIRGQQLAIYRQPNGEHHRTIINPAPLGETALAALPNVAVALTGLF